MSGLMGARDKLLAIVRNAKGDDLERAHAEFRGLNLDEPHGTSGRTRRQVLIEYERERIEWEDAADLLLELLK